MSDEEHVHNDECWQGYEEHNCHFCGEYVCKEGFGADKKRHYLSDCRPDLVEHEIGDTCTWIYMGKPLKQFSKFPCYAYQNRITNEWTKEHIHFYPDGPM